LISFSSFAAFLVNVIQDEPGFIVGPISWFLGVILNFIFNIVYFFTENFSLGISIIVVTIIARFIMLPLAFKQQKSMVVMRKIQPEIRRIQDKYKDDMADPEVKRKMNTEMQKLYSKHKYNPFSGCLPLIIQLPIFIALYYIMQNSYAFIDTINVTYKDIANVIIEDTKNDKDSAITLLNKKDDINIIRDKNEKDRTDSEKQLLNDYDSNKFVFWYDFSKNEITPMVPEDLSDEFDTLDEKYMIKAFDKFSIEQWKMVKDVFKSEIIDQNVQKKENIEYFGFGINLTEIAGFALPGIVITLLSGLTTFLSSWLMMRKNKNMDSNSAMQSQQKIMMITMPLIMAWITSGLPCGVGLYWIISNIFMIVQQQALNKYYEKKLLLEEGNLSNIIDEPGDKKKKSRGNSKR